MSPKHVFLTGLLLLSSSAYAELVVNRSIVTYKDSASMKEDVVIFNSNSDQNLYVQVDAYEVLNPGTAEQTLVKINLEEQPEFVASPNKLVVSPGDRSIVRLLNLKNENLKERVYRVNLVPMTPPVELVGTGEEMVQSKLEVVVAYQVLAIVLPDNPQPELVYDRANSVAYFQNQGNANYLLTEGQQCNPVDPDDCVELESRRVYPGNDWAIDLPFKGPFTYKVKTHDGLVSRQFN